MEKGRGSRKFKYLNIKTSFASRKLTDQYESFRLYHSTVKEKPAQIYPVCQTPSVSIQAFPLQAVHPLVLNLI